MKQYAKGEPMANLLKLNEPFLLISYCIGLPNGEPDSDFELITLSDHRKDESGYKISERQAERLIASGRGKEFKNSYGVIYDFFGFRNFLKEEKEDSRKLFSMVRKI